MRPIRLPIKILGNVANTISQSIKVLYEFLGCLLLKFMTNLTIPDTEAIKFTIGADIAKGISSIKLITELTAPLPERPPKFEIRI